MSHELSFSLIHKSITNLNTITIPKFVVLTGRNGAGKTHLLEALDKGHVESTLISNPESEIRLFDWNSIIPLDTGIFNPSQHRVNQSNWFLTVRNRQDLYLPQLQQFASTLGIPASLCTSFKKIYSIGINDLQNVLSDSRKVSEVYEQIRQRIENIGRNVYNDIVKNVPDQSWKIASQKISQENPELFLVASESEFYKNRNFSWGEVDPFQQEFGRIFTHYRDLLQENILLEKYPPQNDKHKKYLSDSEFKEEYGVPPWDFVNKILEVSHLDFRVNHPPLHEKSSYEPQLYKLSSDVDEMRFKDLSSGEKILMSFALCLYNSKETRQRKVFPKLLLLDEVDAPLHPSMIQSLLNTINDVLVEEQGVSVILTT